jgi:hypothetical protein
MSLKSKSTMFRGKTEKVKSLVARLALMIAAKENPALIERYQLQRQKFLQLKMMIIKKYTPKAIMAARKLLQAPPAKK